MGMRFILNEDDPAYPILRDGLPYILYPDVQLTGGRFKEVLHNHILSWLAIPLYVSGKLIGMFALDGFTRNLFTDSHARFALTFANQVAVALENSRLYTELHLELEERQRIEVELRQREAILDAVAELAEKPLKAPDWRTEITDMLEGLGKTLSASHAYLFENHPDQNGGMLISIRYEWTAPLSVSDLNNPLYHYMPVHEPGLDRWYGLIMQGQPFVGDAARSSPAEMEILRERGMKAVLDVPIFVNGKWWGIVGFDDELNERIWTSAEVDALKVAEMFSARPSSAS